MVGNLSIINNKSCYPILFPSGAGDSLGGDSRSQLFAQLSAPLVNGGKVFLFANFGSLGNSDHWKIETFASTRKKVVSPLLTPGRKRQSLDVDELVAKVTYTNNIIPCVFM